MVGEVPRELNGSFYRCGGDHLYPTMENDNLNNGDGVMAAFHFEDGYVDFIQRYVKTERFLLERKNRRRLYGAYRNGYADAPETAAPTATTPATPPPGCTTASSTPCARTPSLTTRPDHPGDAGAA